MPKRKNDSIVIELRKQIKLMQEQLDAVQPPEEPSEPEVSDTESDTSQKDGQEIDIKLHSSLSVRWKHWTANGVPKQEMEDLLSKYARQEGLDAPKLNLEVSFNLGESAVKRDKFITENQKSVGSALSAVGSALSMLLEEDESIDKLVFVERLSDATKILSDLHFRLSESRKAFILPGMTKQSKDVLSTTKMDEFLFGKNLSDKLKEARALDKLTQGMRYQQSKAGNQNPSTAFLKGVDLSIIRKTAGWSNSSKMFAKVYNRPLLIDNQVFAKAVIH
ncbi:uncharacterized protein LOC123272220 [Cotesia glomerata]|uniref:uncharacterized protein LOC123272220 n=1 Tax=Cotesia glomerata TaxID=32391 RepID=UPI001D01F22F|nr:uncharacterized protein LOC123272220 [Cotesia glomerata]